MARYERLTYVNENNESIVLGAGCLFHANLGSKDCSGLSEFSSTIYSTYSMGQHGDTFVSDRIEPRNIDISGTILERSKDAQLQLRRRAIRIFNPDLSAKLIYEYKGFKRVISCRVDNSPVFSYTEDRVYMKFSMSFKCLDPFWREEQETATEIASWMGGWEFPTEIKRDDPTSMQFGFRSESLIVDCYNAGDVSTGLRIRFTALATVENPSLINVNTYEKIKLNLTMLPGDVITIDTSYGSKDAVLTRAGETSSCFRDVDIDSTYMQLEIGDNLFRYDADSGLDSLNVTLFYSPKYLGV